MKWPFEWNLCWFSKPDPKDERWVKVWGLNWGLFPGWHYGNYHNGYVGDGKGGLVFEKRRKGWWHHSTCKITPAFLWKYVPDPNIRKED